MKEEILEVFEDFVVENWGRLVLEETLASAGWRPDNTQINLPHLLALLASHQRLDLKDIVFAFGRYSFPHFAAKVPRHDRAYEHPKKFLMAIHKLLSFENEGSGFVHFHYVDCGPEELVMIYKSRQSFSSFVEGFIEGAAQSFAHQIECRPVSVREGDVSGCRFHLTFKGER